MDPTKVAEMNDGCEGVAMADMAPMKEDQDFDPTRDSLKEVLAAGKAAFDWDNKWHLPGTKRLPNGNYHGVGFTSIINWATDPTTPKSAALTMRYDGTCYVLQQSADTGTGHGTAH
jgi:hypothetical protein